VVAQVLLAKTGGGRVAAREVLLNTASVAKPSLKEKRRSWRSQSKAGAGMAWCHSTPASSPTCEPGVVDVTEPIVTAADRPAFVALLKRHGIDTSAVDRFEQSGSPVDSWADPKRTGPRNHGP